MKKRIIAVIALLALALTALSACENHYEFAGKTYLYEKLIGDDTFTVQINDDGTFICSDNADNTEYTGKWRFRNDTLTLKTSDGLKNKFLIVDGDLVFVAEGSDGFGSVAFADEDKFICIS